MARTPSTAATRLLREMGVAYSEHSYRYEQHGGTRVAARTLGVDEHAVLKTLIMERTIAALPRIFVAPSLVDVALTR